MARLVILGSSSAVSDARHDNSHMVLEGAHEAVVIDCASNPLVRLAQAGVTSDQVKHLVTTHFHPDHVYGVPILFMNMWLTGRHNLPLAVYGLHHTLDRIERMMEDYGWSEWPDFFPVSFHRLPERENVLVLDDEDFRITCSPSVHLVPTIAVRVLSKDTGKVMVYSSDTTPCESVARLVEGADILIHEATGQMVGHSSPAQAAAVARNGGVRRLVLIHYRVDADPEGILAEARAVFGGPVELAEDFREYPL